MGFRTLIEINHDTFREIDKDAFFEDMSRYVASGDRDQAQRIFDEHGVRVISMRDYTGAYYVSNKTDGFPTQLPYDEELDRQNREWAQAVEKAKAILGGAAKVRTMADLRAVITGLMNKITI